MCTCSSQHLILSCNGPDIPSFHLLSVKKDLLAIGREAKEAATEAATKAAALLTDFVLTLDNNNQTAEKAKALAWPR